MNICHVSSVHSCRDIRILEKECVSLAKLSDNNVSLVAQGETGTYKGVNIIGVFPTRGGRFYRMIRHSKKVIDVALATNADIYHLHDPELLIFAMKIKRKNKKVIFDSHEDYYKQIQIKQYIPFFFRKIIALIYKKYETHICKKIDGVIFPCPIKGENIFENRCKHFEYIDNVPILEEFISCNADVKKNASFSVCYLGTLLKERGILEMIKACYITNTKLILAGNFASESYEKELRNCLCFDIVDYRGICSREEIKSIYKESSLCIHVPLDIGQYGRGDNLATKVYEAMIMGIPCILSSAKKKIAEEYEFAITVTPGNVEELAKAIEYIKRNRKLAYQMGINGKKRIFENLNWEMEEKKLFNFYEVINNNE